jgi:ribonuclease D
MTEAELPAMHIPNDGPPQARLWMARDPVAAARLAAVRGALTAIAAQHNVPVENLLTPDYVRRIAWRPPSPLTPDVVDQALADYGARPWQRELTVTTITPLLADPVDGDDA